MIKNLEKNFLLGLTAGIILTFILFSLANINTIPRHGKSEILAEIDGAKLTRHDLENKLAGKLVPIESDQYKILREGVEFWLHNQMLDREARSKNLSVKDLYAKEIWSQVRVTPGDVQEYYKKNSDLYGSQNFDTLQPVLARRLRDVEFEKVKSEYLKKLSDKYHAKIHLEKPSSVVNSIALPPPNEWLAAFPDAKLAQPQGAPRPAAPAAAAPAAGTIVAFNDLAGRPTFGPADAPVTLVIFSDFHCPFCGRVEPTIDELFKAYPGKIKKVWRHYPLPFHAGADRTHEASECMNEQGKFWEYHKKLMENVSAAKTDATLAQYAQEVGGDKGKLEACLSSGKYKELVQKEIARGKEVGVNGTPAFFINGRSLVGAQPLDSFKNLVEVALDPSKAAALLKPAAPANAPKPPPTNVQFTDLEGRPSEGPKDAPITMVIFSDFHCPFCKRVEPTIDQLMKNYQGKIRKVWRQYPLPFHAGADRAAEASECANEQGKFWEYHKGLFDNMGNTKDDESLKKVAKDANLDQKKFEQCLSSNKYKELVKQEIAKAGSVGVTGTPAVFINGQLVSGAQPYDNFDAVVKAKLGNK